MEFIVVLYEPGYKRRSMEKADHDLISRLSSENPTLKRLYREHRQLDKALKKFDRYAALSSSAAMRQQELKKQKLAGVDSMMELISEFR